MSIRRPSDKSVFVEVKDASGGPDGACLGFEGFYCSCIYAEDEIPCFDPARKIERRVPMPIKDPTMPALGGQQLKTHCVTPAAHAMSPEERARRPDEGGLFALESPAAGVLPDLFSGGYG